MAKQLTYKLSLIPIIVFLCVVFIPFHSAHAEYVYTTQFGSSGSGNGQFYTYSLKGIAIATSTGDVYVVDRPNSRIQVFSSSGTFLYTFGWGVSDGASSFEVCSAPATCQAGVSGSGNGQFNYAWDVAISPVSGNIYVTDADNNRVEVFSPSGTYLSKFGSYGSGNGQFSNAQGIALDSSGNIYVLDSDNNRVEIFNSSGTFVKTFGWGVSDGASSFEVCSAPATCQAGVSGSGNGEFTTPFDMAVDSSGNIYVLDADNNRVEIFNSSDAYQSQFGSSGSGNGQFSNAQGIALDSSGNIYVGDQGNNRLQVFNSSGTFLYTFGWGVSDGASAFETCSAPSTCEAGVGGSGNGQFADFSPDSIAFDSSGNLYAGDYGNARIEVFSPPAVAPSVTTSAASSVATSSLTLNGSITATGGASITPQSGFAYGTSSNLTTGVSTTTLGSQSGAVSFDDPITGLSPGTTYYFEAYAVNSAGTSTGSILSTTTLPVPATVTTQSASSINTTSATGNGDITSTGGINPTVEGFVYGLTTSYGATTTTNGSFSTGTFTSSISGLTCNTTYDYKAYATNSVGTGYGSNETFTTSACPTGGSAGSVSSSGGSVSASVLSSLLAPSASTTAYLNSLAVSNCPQGFLCTANPSAPSLSTCPTGFICTANPSPTPTPPASVPTSHEKKSVTPSIPSIPIIPATAIPSTPPSPPTTPSTPTILSPSTNQAPNSGMVSSAIGSISSFGHSVGEGVRTILAKPIGNASEKILLIFGLASDAVLVTEALLLGPLSSASTAVQVPFKFMMTMLGGAGLSKRRKPWGAVYDSQTKRPLDPAIVTLMKGNTEVDSSITDLQGRYGFLTAPGTYHMKVGKTNYRFPSKELKGKSEDEVYTNLYFGEDINVLQGQVINKNIPLDPIKFDWNEYAKKDQKLISFYGRHILTINRILETLFAIGLVFSTFAAIAIPSVFNIIVVCLYVLLFLTRIGQSRAYGQVVDKTTGKPLPFALVEVSIPGTTIAKKATDIMGRYYCLVRPGTYSLSVDEKNTDGSYTTAYVSNPFRARGIIKRKVGV